MGVGATADGEAPFERADSHASRPGHDRSQHAGDDDGRLIVMGLGPGSLARVPAHQRAVLEDPKRTVVVRTLHHPAAAELAEQRDVVTCDDLYESAERFADVYSAIVERVLSRAGPVVYAVPGSPLVGEFAVTELLERVPDAELLPAESFVDAILRRVGYDPFDRGLRIINGHELPSPLALDAPTIIGHLDRPEIFVDVAATLSRALPDGAEVWVCVDIGGPDEQMVPVPIDQVPAGLAGFRTSFFVDTPPAGLVGVVAVSRRLRQECPWDREQTHRSLVRHLVEEAYELIEAISALPEADDEIDYVAYDGVEEELGDVLLQVLFHAAIAAERGVFDIDDVATRLQEKLVRRHPHVFGSVEVADAAEVAANWESIKQTERVEGRDSLLDGVPVSLPALERAEALQRRAARVGFDWDSPVDVVATLRQEVDELEKALDEGDPVHEIGDVLFSAVNLVRLLGVSGEEALRRASARFERRFRAMEAAGPLQGLSLEELDARWEAAKDRVG